MYPAKTHTAQRNHPPSIGALIRTHRRRKRLTQIELAAAAQVSPTTVRNLERGRGRLSSFGKIIRALSLQLLLDGSTHTPLLRLRGVRERADYSLRFVSARMRVSRRSLSALESGGPGRLETLVDYAAAISAVLTIAPRARKKQPPDRIPRD